VQVDLGPVVELKSEDVSIDFEVPVADRILEARQSSAKRRVGTIVIAVGPEEPRQG
jgi:hypothetical protein